jgi:hypothetical protein
MRRVELYLARAPTQKAVREWRKHARNVSVLGYAGWRSRVLLIPDPRSLLPGGFTVMGSSD